jgi:hypothetical protein
MKFNASNIGKIIVAFSFLMVIILIMNPPQFTKNEVITKFNIQLTNGTYFQPFMEGEFVINAEASENLIRLELFFNSIKIHETDDQNLIYSFNTDNFPKGKVNITLRGQTNQGEMIQITRDCIFIGPELRYTIIVIASSMVVVGVYMFFRIKNSEKDKKR